MDLFTQQNQANTPSQAGLSGVEQSRPMTKKQQILSLYKSGIHQIDELAELTKSRSSYVASVLQKEGHISGYHDLYTSTAHSMNVYSKFFAGRMGFKNKAAARRSVALIDRLYQRFEQDGDRAGQHHALSTAMVMFNRARWTGKADEAEIFQQWLLKQLNPGKKPLTQVMPLHPPKTTLAA